MKEELQLSEESVLAEIPVTLSVQLGELQLSAAELVELERGSVLAFDFDPLGPLSLSVGGVQVGTGRLAVEDEQFKLEITDLFEEEDAVILSEQDL